MIFVYHVFLFIQCKFFSVIKKVSRASDVIMNCIEVKDVYKSYKNNGENLNVLNGLNLVVRYGEMLAFIKNL